MIEAQTITKPFVPKNQARKQFTHDWLATVKGRSSWWVRQVPSHWGSPRSTIYESQALDHLRQIREAIERSKRILDLEEDWDSEGAKPYKKETWQRAVKFLETHARELLTKEGSTIRAPKILPGPDGSIDIHWEEPSYELLINIPAEPTKKASFYGDDKDKICIKGTLDTSAVSEGLLVWLKK